MKKALLSCLILLVGSAASGEVVKTANILGFGQMNVPASCPTNGWTDLYAKTDGGLYTMGPACTEIGVVLATRQVNGHALSSNVTVTANDVGLGAVPNVDATNPANIVQTSTYRFASDAEKSTWNGKLDPSLFNGVVRYLDINKEGSYTADGSIDKPWKTPQDAYAAITDASESKRYLIEVVGGGTFDTTSLGPIVPKSYVYMHSGRTTIFTATSGCTISASSMVSPAAFDNVFITNTSSSSSDAAVCVSGTGNLGFFNSSIQGLLNGAEGMIVTGGIVIAQYTTFVGWDWGVKVTGGQVISENSTFTGYLYDVIANSPGQFRHAYSWFTTGGLDPAGTGTITWNSDKALTGEYHADVNGNDANNCSATFPCKTVQHTLSKCGLAVNNRCYVKVHSGEYSENITYTSLGVTDIELDNSHIKAATASLPVFTWSIANNSSSYSWRPQLRFFGHGQRAIYPNAAGVVYVMNGLEGDFQWTQTATTSYYPSLEFANTGLVGNLFASAANSGAQTHLRFINGGYTGDIYPTNVNIIVYSRANNQSSSSSLGGAITQASGNVTFNILDSTIMNRPWLLGTAGGGGGGGTFYNTAFAANSNFSYTPVEVTRIVANADVGGGLNNKYFLLNVPSGNGYYVWFNVAGGGTDPGPIGSRTGIMVAIASGASASTIASAMKTAIDTGASADYSTALGSTSSGSVLLNGQLYVTNKASGIVTDASDDGATGFGLSVLRYGSASANSYTGVMAGDANSLKSYKTNVTAGSETMSRLDAASGVANDSATVAGTSVADALDTLRSQNAGSQIYTGAGVPSDGTGVNNDFYVRTSTGDYYQKAAGTWGSIKGNLMGPAGSGTAWQAYGGGTDGVVTCTTANSLTRDMYYDTLTINAGCSINTSGYKIFVKNTLDLTNAPANGIQFNGNAGNSATNQTGASAPAAQAGVTIGGVSAVGTAGATATAGTGAQAAAGTATALGNGGASGAGAPGGCGGSSCVTPGGTLRAATAVTAAFPIGRYAIDLIKSPSTLINGGASAPGGGSGANDGTAVTGGGGSGANSGGVVGIWARVIARASATTVACAISARGGLGGNGKSATAGNRGGGGAGAGGGGGWVYLMNDTQTGDAVTGLICADGGNAGTSGDGFGAGSGADGGAGGAGGRVTLGITGTNTWSDTFGSAGTAGGAHSGVTHGSVGTGNQVRVNL